MDSRRIISAMVLKMDSVQILIQILCLFFLNFEGFLVTSIGFTSTVFDRNADMRLSHASFVQDSRSAKDCVAICAVEAGCVYVSYHSMSAKCELSDKEPNNTTVTLDVVSGWDVYARKAPCEFGWYSYNGSCYILQQEQTDWATARAECELLGAHLVDIHTENEYNFITGVITSEPMQDVYWIGANDLDQDGVITWSDGSRVNDSFSAWQPYQPDNWLSSEYCVHMRVDLTWNDKACGAAGWRICEK